MKENVHAVCRARGHSHLCALVEKGSLKVGHGPVTYLQIQMKAMPTCKNMGLYACEHFL